jgi:hypothetical protein
MNLHLADGGYYDNSGVAALVQWLHNGLRDLADRDLATRLSNLDLSWMDSVV